VSAIAAIQAQRLTGSSARNMSILHFRGHCIMEGVHLARKEKEMSAVCHKKQNIATSQISEEKDRFSGLSEQKNRGGIQKSASRLNGPFLLCTGVGEAVREIIDTRPRTEMFLRPSCGTQFQEKPLPAL
jgi:hypothetical protein